MGILAASNASALSAPSAGSAHAAPRVRWNAGATHAEAFELPPILCRNAAPTPAVHAIFKGPQCQESRSVGVLTPCEGPANTVGYRTESQTTQNAVRRGDGVHNTTVGDCRRSPRIPFGRPACSSTYIARCPWGSGGPRPPSRRSFPASTLRRSKRGRIGLPSPATEVRTRRARLFVDSLWVSGKETVTVFDKLLRRADRRGRRRVPRAGRSGDCRPGPVVPAESAQCRAAVRHPPQDGGAHRAAA